MTKSNSNRPQFSTERLSMASEGIRLWFGKAWEIGVLMAKGAYLLGERRRLLLKLGEEAFTRLKAEEWKATELEQLVKQLDRVTKKIDIEEKRIHTARFGEQGVVEETSPPAAPDTEAKSKPEKKGKQK